MKIHNIIKIKLMMEKKYSSENIQNLYFDPTIPFSEVTVEGYTQWVVSQLYNGVFWVYSYTDQLLSYDFSSWVFNLQTTYFDESYDWLFQLYTFNIFTGSGFKLFWSVVIDDYLYSLLYKLPYDDYWFRTMIASKEYSFIPMYYPEVCIAVRNSNNFLSKFFASSYVVSVFDLLSQEIIITSAVIIIQLFLLIYIIILLIMLYFSFFGSSSKEENTIDTDYTVVSSTVESEEDVSSLDDIINIGSLLFIIFGWFVYNNFLLIATEQPDLAIVFAFLPTIAFIVLGIPSILLLDFGIFFLAYLRGVGPKPEFLLELMYDYIAVVAYYVRLLVQCVRLLLMLFTFIELQEYILYFATDQRMWHGYETFWDDLSKLNLSSKSITHFLLIKMPTRIFAWIYEILHTFFIITAQFASFLAMVFWLFFFLFTLFVAEKLERHLNEHRKVRINLIKELWSYKKEKKESKEFILTLKKRK